MNQTPFEDGALVVGRDGGEIGRVVGRRDEADATGIDVLLQATTDEVLTVPLDAVDRDASTPDRVVLTTRSEALLRAEPDLDAGDVMVAPLFEEQIRVHRHEVDRGSVRIHRHVETVPIEVPVELRTDDVAVERVPVGTIVDTAPEVRQEGDITIVPVVEEVLVVEKRLRLVEEIRITRRDAIERTTVRDTVRREAVEVTKHDLDTGEHDAGEA